MTSYRICLSLSIRPCCHNGSISFFLFWPRHMSYRILVPRAGIKPVTHAVKHGILTSEQPRKPSFLEHGRLVFHYMYHDFFIHLPADGRLGCSRGLAVVSDTTENMRLRHLFKLMISFPFFSCFKLLCCLCFRCHI